MFGDGSATVYIHVKVSQLLILGLHDKTSGKMTTCPAPFSIFVDRASHDFSVVFAIRLFLTEHLKTQLYFSLKLCINNLFSRAL
jgi:hypothetical protein